ncbi:hypothetical protein DFH09DRAFT_899920, partial [Mycena vulgaris]
KCQVCFRTPFHDTTHTFSVCQTCKLAWWCSECEKRFGEVHTGSHCKDLATVRAVDSVKTAYFLARRSPQRFMLRTENARTSYLPPSSLSGWADYHDRIFPKFKFATEFVAREFQSVHPDAVRAVELLATDSASIPLTLLHALEIAIPTLQTRSTLCIHIVAADERELMSKGMLEEILHYLPKLKSVTVVYVGPNVYPADEPNLACSACQRAGRRRIAIRSSSTYTIRLYHKFATTPTYRANPPDLVAGFNTGMGEVETAGWKASMAVVLDSAVPAVFTTYTMYEAINDTNMLRGVGAFFLKNVEKNSWRGGIPMIQERFEEWGADHYVNNYWFMVRGRETQVEPLD